MGVVAGGADDGGVVARDEHAAAGEAFGEEGGEDGFLPAVVRGVLGPELVVARDGVERGPIVGAGGAERQPGPGEDRLTVHVRHRPWR